MKILYNETKLTDQDTEGVFDMAAASYDNVTLCGVFRAVVLNHEKHDDLAVLKEKMKMSYATIWTPGDIQVYKRADQNKFSVLLNSSGPLENVKIDDKEWETFDEKPYMLNTYLSQFQQSKIYINRSQQRIIAIIQGGTELEDWAQAAASMLWVMMPWYYPEEPTKDKDVTEFFKTIAVQKEHDKDEEIKQLIINYINDATNDFDFRKEKLRTMLKGFSDLSRQRTMSNLRSTIQTLLRYIQDYNTTLANKYNELSMKQTELIGLEKIEPQNDDKFLEFFDSHKNLELEKIQDGKLYYNVTDTLEFYDEAEAKLLLENVHSWANDGRFSQSMIEALKWIFVEKRGRFRVNAKFNLTDQKYVQPISGSYRLNNYCMPNPHIYFYGCSGANDAYYAQYAKSGDWDLAIEQTISATKNWSVGDSTVGAQMFNWIKNNMQYACIYITDGSPIEKIDDKCKIVNFKDFKSIVAKKIKEENK